MAHIPYGYKIENGRILIDNEKAKKLEMAIKLYLSGESLKNTAKKSGIDICHMSMIQMLTNEKYMGDGFYPAIVGAELLEAVKEERKRRVEKLGRTKLKNTVLTVKFIKRECLMLLKKAIITEILYMDQTLRIGQKCNRLKITCS